MKLKYILTAVLLFAQVFALSGSWNKIQDSGAMACINIIPLDPPTSATVRWQIEKIDYDCLGKAIYDLNYGLDLKVDAKTWLLENGEEYNIPVSEIKFDAEYPRKSLNVKTLVDSYMSSELVSKDIAMFQLDFNGMAPGMKVKFGYASEVWEAVFDANASIGFYQRSVNVSICYQETANVSTACGGKDTGSYNWTSSWIDKGNTSDGDWDTFGESYYLSGYMFVNYSKPDNATALNSTWKVKDSSGTAELSIPTACWSQEPLQFRIRSYWVFIGTTTWSCWNGSEWQTLRYTTGSDDIYEEAMSWGMPGGYEPIWCFDCENYTQSSNFTTLEFPIWANITTNETFWKLNGTTPPYQLFQIWADIHLGAYNISFKIPDDAEQSFNLSEGKITNYPLFSSNASSFNFSSFTYRRSLTGSGNITVALIDTKSLISTGKMRSDCADIRVTDTSDNEYEYWTQFCNTTETRIYAKPTDSTEVSHRIYYGYSGATDNANFNATFSNPLLPNGDFEGDATGDPDTWTIVEASGSVDVSQTRAFIGTNSTKYVDDDGGQPTMTRTFTGIPDDTLLEWSVNVDFVTTTGAFVRIGGDTGSNAILGMFMKDNNDIDIYPSPGVQTLNISYADDEWTNFTLLNNMTTLKTKFWVNNQYAGEYDFRKIGGDPTTMIDVAFQAGAGSITTYYLDAMRLFRFSSYATVGSEETGESANTSFSLEWATGWAYCTEHSNCTLDYFCTNLTTFYSQCFPDLSAVAVIDPQTQYPIGNITPCASYTYSGTSLDNATARFEISYSNGTLLYNETASYFSATERYCVTFDMPEGELFDLDFYAQQQPEYAEATSTLDVDVVFLNLTIEFPESNAFLHSSRIFPRIRFQMSDFYKSASCQYITNFETKEPFSVTNNITYDEMPIDLINGENILKVRCSIGGRGLEESVVFETSAVPDIYLLGINLQAHLATQIALHRIKQMIWIFGKPFTIFVWALSFIILFGYTFISAMRSIEGGEP